VKSLHPVSSYLCLPGHAVCGWWPDGLSTSRVEQLGREIHLGLKEKALVVGLAPGLQDSRTPVSEV